MEMTAAKTSDFETVKRFYHSTIELLEGRTDSVKWKKGVYPSDEFLFKSIESRQLFLFEKDKNLVAVAIINEDQPREYSDISWSNDFRKSEVIVIHALAVHPEFHGKGFGKEAMKLIADYGRKTGKKTIRLDILDGNIGAEKLYLSSGFKFVGAKKLYYEDTGLADFKMFEKMI